MGGMNIELHIERLILDGLPVESRERVQAAVEAELTRLWAAGGLNDGLLAGGALPSLLAETIQVTNEAGATQLGSQVAQSVHGGRGNEPAIANPNASTRAIAVAACQRRTATTPLLVRQSYERRRRMRRVRQERDAATIIHQPTE